MRTKEKNAQSHIEMILSFVIFIGFLLTIFIFINPIRQNTVTTSVIDSVQEKIFANVSMPYATISLVINPPIPSGCFNISNNLRLSENIVVRDSTNTRTPASLSSGPGGTISIRSTGDSFYRIYSSSNFDSALVSDGCVELPTTNYSFGVLDVGKDIFYDNLVELNNLYMTDYENLKLALAIPSDFEFAAYHLNNRTVLLNDTLSKHRTRPGNVLSRDIPLKAIKNDASKIDILLNIRVW